MLDLTFASSPIVASHGSDVGVGGISIGSRFPKRTPLSGCKHHLLVYGQIDTERTLASRWPPILETIPGESICSAENAGVPAGGAVLVRPDGYIGFQAAAWNSEAARTLDDLLETLFTPQA